MTNNRIAKFCVLAAGIATLPAISFAGTSAKESKEVKQVIEKCKESCISGDIGLNVVSQYISRGVIYENQGGIIQPYADLYAKIYEGEGILNKASLALGIWSSFHSRKDTGFGRIPEGGSTTRAWFETDFSAGVALTFAKNFTFTPSYYIFTSPNDAFATFQGLNLKLAYDDTDLLGAFALHPYVQVLFELENKISTGVDEGVYYEIGIAPSHAFGPVTVTVPITLGLGSDKFYVNTGNGDETYGFFSAGVTASYNLPFVPECYGTWTVSAGYTYYNLGEGTDYVYSKEDGVGGTIRDHNSNEHVFQGGLQVSF